MNKLFLYCLITERNSTAITIKAKGASSLIHKQDLEKKKRLKKLKRSLGEKKKIKVSQKHLLLKTASEKQLSGR